MRRLLSLELIPILLMACYSARGTDFPESHGTPIRRDGISVAENTDSFPRVWGEFLQSSVTPPRKISDITAILDQQAVDRNYQARIAARLAVSPPPNAHGAQLAVYHRNRADAAFDGGMLETAVAAAEESARYAKESNWSVDTALFRLGLARYYAGLPSKDIFLEAFHQSTLLGNSDIGNFRDAPQTTRVWATRPTTLTSLLMLSQVARDEGDLASARKWVIESDRYFDRTRQLWWLDHHLPAAINARTHGQFELAVGDYQESERWLRKAIAERLLYDSQSKPTRQSTDVLAGTSNRDLMEQKLLLAQALLGQRRVLEAESASREALLFALTHSGKTSPDSALAIDVLAQVIYAQGRLTDAERLYQVEIAIRHDMGIQALRTEVRLADSIALQSRWTEAKVIYDGVTQDIQNAGPSATDRPQIELTLPHIVTLYELRQVPRGVALARDVLERNTELLGPRAAETLLARGLLAVGLFRNGQRNEALKLLAEIEPYYVQWESSTEHVDETQALAGIYRRYVLDAYIEMLVDQGTAVSNADIGTAFRLAEALRTNFAERTVVSSAIRTAIADRDLADLARRQEDTQQQLAAQRAILANALALPVNRQDVAGLNELRKSIESLNAADSMLTRELAQRFPKYASLINPAAASIADTRTALTEDEAIVTLYVGSHQTYVWALDKVGNTAFAKVPLSRETLELKVNSLREALDLNATSGQVRPFDVTLAQELYATLLQPVESGWRGAKRLVVVPSGPLAMIPFGMLVTKASAPPDDGMEPPYSGYKHVPFLAREIALVQVPSVATLVTLRAYSPLKTERKPFIGFGDPWFSVQQAEEAQREKVVVGTRGFRIRASAETERLGSARLDALPRLPDTAQELIEIAISLHADPKTDVYLGPAANEWRVRNMKLDDRRVVVFATHGLLPGDLDGLDQPALALSAPSVAKVEGDGLLTTDKILGLKLNADWVVLSACNTAAGDGAGAEAVSGLGRAFFYAGARALLVTNWPVETTSARKLTTTLFQKQAQDPSLPRAEALRQSMLSLIDGPGYVDLGSGRTVFSYAHPVFWAPYSLVGDGH